MRVLRNTRAEAPASLSALFAFALVGLSAWETRRVFDVDFRPIVLIVAATLAGVVAYVVSPLIWQLRGLAYIIVTLGLAAAVTAIGASPQPVDVVAAMTHAPMNGFGDVAAAVWPSPTLPTGVAAFAMLIVASAVLTTDFSLRRRAGAALLPPLLTLGVIALLSAEAGAPSLASAVVFVLATLGLLRTQQPYSHSNVSRGFTVGMIVVVGAVPLAAARLADANRYDPRAELSGRSPADSGISPLSRVNLWRERSPATVMFRTDAPDATRWRLVGLTRFDGREWLPADDYRVSGTRVRSSDPALPTKAVQVTLDGLDAAWLPAPDLAVRVSRAVQVDEEVSGLLVDLSTGANNGAERTYRLVTQQRSVTPDQLRSATAARTAVVFTDSFQPPSALISLAQTITAGATSDADRAERIASYLREGFVLDPTSAPGHSLAVIDAFLETTRRGVEEQFVSAFAVLAAADGLPVRISVGFDTVPDASSSSAATIALSTAAVAWPEVKFDGLGWVAFDPVPTEANQQATSPGGGTSGPSEVLDESAPPVTTPAVVGGSTEESSVPTPPAPSTDAAGRSNITLLAVIGAAALAILAVIVYAVTVLAVKQRRLLRRRQAADPRQRVLGAFRSGVDVLVDLGAAVSTAKTDRELVLSGVSLGDDTMRTLAPVARSATAAVYASELVIDDGHADDAWQRVHALQRQAAKRVGWRRALLARLSLRSLRRGLPDQ